MRIARAKSLAAAMAVWLLASCGAGDPGPAGSTPPAQATETTASAVDRVLSSKALSIWNSASGVGPDTDGNGVRDDIDAYIQKTWGADFVKAKATTQTASAIQSAVASGLLMNAAAAASSPANSPTASQLEAVSQRLDDAVSCLAARFAAGGAGSALTQLENATTNTKERYLAYRAYHVARSGTSRASAGTDPTLKCK